MKALGGIILLLGLAALGLGVYGFIKLGSGAQTQEMVNIALGEMQVNVSGFTSFAINNRFWLAICGGIATLLGCGMAFRK